jgi:DNA-binding transcriptional LysR family regulator
VRKTGGVIMTNMLYECFVAAVETLSFTSAAQKIHITQPAFSRNIATLESEFGFPLFWRSKQNGLRVTPAGLAMYNGLKKMEEEYMELLNHAKSINRGEEGQLIISILSGWCMDSKTVSLIHEFRRRYPQVEVILKSCTLAELLDSVEKGKSDVCFSSDVTIKNRENLLYQFVYSVESYLAVPARLKCDKEKTYELKDFQDEVFLLSKDAPEINTLFVEACRQDGFEPKTRMAPDYETKMLWVEIGLGLAGNSKEHYMKDSKHVDFIKVKDLHDIGYTLVWNKENYNPAIALFYSILDEVMTS